ncbi:DUF4328 domain-containing protein [Mycobacterium angelicum]|uniref:DUF4328 domain-containing protein n=1 Tax=Mycobacterium angelicum TaxID=470074 RepID=A0A1W9ZJH9_MYCAN|nr:DUF4328 domain-containing protein [Mycobacterium angelicum]MCV7198910.1 DUF4328 domain-containing protein [Mycobacterium angelicum]ORA16359.1 hypothetical protein BST12_20925 [Mycobacterium angelicum]
MIQVCSQCGTRWNVRERQRQWCPRCRGALMAPLADVPQADPRWRTPATPQQPTAPAIRITAPRLPPGFRWIAVRPGAAPPVRSGRRSRGPTPRYAVIPRWGLGDRVDQAGPAAANAAPPKSGPSAVTVRTMLFATLLTLCVAALVFVIRYVLLIINRSILLHSWVAAASVWLGYLVSVAALVAVGASAVLLIQWLIARRAAALHHAGLPEPRSVRSLWAGCLVPLANLFWAPVYVIELASIEDHYRRLRRPILVWWLVWVLSNAISIFAIATSWVSDAQGIANNTVTMVLAYLCAAATIAALTRVFEGFELKPVERPAHRWLVVADDRPAPASAGAVELEGQEPAA